MSNIELTTPARQALIALLLHGEEATNPILRERFRFEIEKAPRELLLKDGFISVGLGKNRANLHKLTGEGQKRARAELAESAPKGAGAGVQLLYAMANVLDRVMTEQGLDTEKVFMSGGVHESPIPPPVQSVEDQVRGAYAALSKRRGDLVSLVRLRERLVGVERETLDKVLKAMDRARVIQLEPDPNRKALSREAHEAALRIGGEDKHFITIGHR